MNKDETNTGNGRCPKCNSPHPHLHPAVQFGGEVGICVDRFHLRTTPQNTPQRIANVQAMIASTPFREEEQ
jgi:hypothetical protein